MTTFAFATVTRETADRLLRLVTQATAIDCACDAQRMNDILLEADSAHLGELALVAVVLLGRVAMDGPILRSAWQRLAMDLAEKPEAKVVAL